MIDRWKQVKLGSIAEFKNGINYTKSNFGKGIKVINVRDFQDNSIPTYDLLDEIDPKGIICDDNLLKPGDIIFVRSNGNRNLIGRSLFIRYINEDVTHSAFTIRARFTSVRAIPRFFAYLFRLDIIRSMLSAYGGGTNISNLTQSILSNLLVPLPPVSIQEKIVDILSAYDDLIENNTRRIAILEEMARSLYREWFVNFRFPGHEEVKMVDSPLGPIPEGWVEDYLATHIQIDKGISYKGEFLTNTGLPLVNLKCIISNGKFRRDGIKPYSGDYKQKHIVQPGDIVIANTDLTQAGNVIGTPAIVPKILTSGDILFSHHLYAIRFLENARISKFYLYHLLNTNEYKAYAKGCANGTTVLGLPPDGILGFSFKRPTLSLMNRFEMIVAPIYKQIEILECMNEKLAVTRDLLLPRLIFG